MQVKEILKLACSFLGKEELLDCEYFEENGEEITESVSKELDKLLTCLNVVTEEVAMSYLPLIKQKEVTFVNGKISVLDIDENIASIISIKNKSGRNLKYKYVSDEIVCLTTKAIVTYKVYPSHLNLDGTAETFGNRLSARILAYGVASEFAYSEMLYDDATIWENRFKNALLYSSEKKGELNLKQRGWY